MTDNIKIAVRVRPFNQREIERGAKLIVKMSGDQTILTNPDDDQPRPFAFDYSYWSHDGFKTDENGYCIREKGSWYADQKKVFDDLGTSVIENTLNGFNTTLLAYGQTGSGKSYSMMGYGANKGVVPLICEELFRKIGEADTTKQQCHLTLGMLEIYNEKVRDLLDPDMKNAKHLQVKQSKTLGFYPEDLKYVPLSSYQDVELLIERGTRNRTVAATNMNQSSSRAHTIVMLTFTQINHEDMTERRSIINLVDLAGSERVDNSGVQGQGLKEAASINKSLSMLGNVINALVQQQQGNKKILVPYRDSVLTKLLMNALGGNSKTIMIAAISPADINYDETLSTLRFMDRAKSIKTKAVVNETESDKLIRELKEELDRLKAEMEKSAKQPAAGKSSEDIRKFGEMEEELVKKQRFIEEMQKSWDQRLQEAQQEIKESLKEEKSLSDAKKRQPYFTNLNEDSLLNGVVALFIQEGENTLGKKNADGEQASIQISGFSIQTIHANITCKKLKGLDFQVSLQPVGDAKVLVNGSTVNSTKPVSLSHNDRILFGTSSIFLFKMPNRERESANDPTWAMAQREIAKNQGYTAVTNNSTALKALYDDITEVLPHINDINAMSEEMERQKKFELVIGADSTLVIKVTDTYRGYKWIWTKEKLLNSRFLMEELYNMYQEFGMSAIEKLTAKNDPFYEPPEDWLIGTGRISLKSLTYLLDIHETIMVTDYKGSNEGILKVDIELGKKVDAKSYDGNAQSLIGKPFGFTIRLGNICGLRWNKGSIKLKYTIRDYLLKPKRGKPGNNKVAPDSGVEEFMRSEIHWTKPIEKISNNIEISDEYVVDIEDLSAKALEGITRDSLVIEVWGEQQQIDDAVLAERGLLKALPKRKNMQLLELASGKNMTADLVRDIAKIMADPDMANGVEALDKVLTEQFSKFDILQKRVVEALQKNQDLERNAEIFKLEIDGLKVEIGRLNEMHYIRNIDHTREVERLKREIINKFKALWDEARTNAALRVELADAKAEVHKLKSEFKPNRSRMPTTASTNTSEPISMTSDYSQDELNALLKEKDEEIDHWKNQMAELKRQIFMMESDAESNQKMDSLAKDMERLLNMMDKSISSDKGTINRLSGVMGATLRRQQLESAGRVGRVVASQRAVPARSATKIDDHKQPLIDDQHPQKIPADHRSGFRALLKYLC